jgi:hypothetical protein
MAGPHLGRPARVTCGAPPETASRRIVSGGLGRGHRRRTLNTSMRSRTGGRPRAAVSEAVSAGGVGSAAE